MSNASVAVERRSEASASGEALPFPDLSERIGARVLLVRELSAADKEEALRHMVELLAAAGFVHDAGVVGDALLERERIAPTGLLPGVAVPHCRSEMVDRLVVVLAFLTRPVPFDALDGPPVDRIFLVVAPHTAAAQYLDALAKIARLVRDDKWPETIFKTSGSSRRPARKRSPRRSA